MKNIHKSLFLSLVAVLFFSSTTFAQAKTEKEVVIIKKVIDENGVETEEKIVLKGADAEKYLKENEVEVTEVETELDGVKEISVEVTTEDGDVEHKVIRVDVSGTGHDFKDGDKLIYIDGDGEEIPEDLRKMLEEKGIDIESLIKEGQSKVEVKEKQHYKMVEIDDDGNKKVIEWNGEGEMPEELKEIMEEHDVAGHIVEKKVMMVEGEDVDIDIEGERKVIKIRKNKNGDVTEDVFEMEGDEEFPQEVKDLLKEHGIDPADLEGEGQKKVRIEIEEGHGLHDHEGDHEEIYIKDLSTPNKAQLGVMVEEDGGVKVIEFTEGGAAESAGVKINDIIVKVNKSKITDLNSLIDVLKDKEPGDVVKLKVLRNGKTKKVKVAMKEAAPVPSPSTTENFRTKHKVLKIEGGDIVKCKPGEETTQREQLTEEEIEVVEERIIEETGMKEVAMKSGPNTLDIGDLDLFPNPTDGTIRVRFQIDSKEDTKVQIIDIAGRALYENTIEEFSGFFDEEIDLSGKGMGTLVLVITQGQSAFTEKIILN